LHDWQDYVGLLESIPQQYAQEQLLTPGSLSQAGAPEMRRATAVGSCDPPLGCMKSYPKKNMGEDIIQERGIPFLTNV